MAAGYKAGDKAYIVESNRIVRKCTVVRPAGNLFIIRFENGGGIWVNKNQLFAIKEAAEESIPKAKPIDMYMHHEEGTAVNKAEKFQARIGNSKAGYHE